MTKAHTLDRQLVVLELDGAVVHDHTPSELIRSGFPLEPERYDQALDLYEKESAGDAIRSTTPKSRRANLRSVFEILFPDD